MKIRKAQLLRRRRLTLACRLRETYVHNVVR